MGKYPIIIGLFIVSCYFMGTYSAFASSLDVVSAATGPISENKVDAQPLVQHHKTLHFTACLVDCLASMEQDKEEDHWLQSLNHFSHKHLPFSLDTLYSVIQPKSLLINAAHVSLYILDCALIV